MRQALASLMFAAAGAAHAGPASWVSPVDGFWGDAARWSSGVSPGFGFEHALIAVPGVYTVSLDLDLYKLSSLTITNPDAELFIPNGRRMYLAGGLHNDGLMTIRSTGLPGTIVSLLSGEAIGGGGVLRLDSNGGEARLVGSSPDEVVHQETHTIAGSGRVEGVFRNQGLVVGDAPGGALVLAGQWVNEGVLGASNGGTLRFDLGVVIDQTPGGTVLADGGNIEIGTATLRGATLESTNGGAWFVAPFAAAQGEDLTIPADTVLTIRHTGKLRLGPGSVVNAGSVVVNDTGLNGNTWLIAADGLTLDGDGALRLNGPTGGAALRAENSNDRPHVTNGADHRIVGAGSVIARITNLGLIDADIAGQTLSLLMSNSLTLPSINLGTMRATAGILQLNGDIELSEEHGLVADGGVVRLTSGSYVGGVVRAEPGSEWQVSASTFVRGGLRFEGPGRIAALPNSGGSAKLNFDENLSIVGDVTHIGQLIANADATLSGPAFLRSLSGWLVANNDATMTIGPDITFIGDGTIAGRFLNLGQIIADDGTLVLAATELTNQGHILVDGGTIRLQTPSIEQGPGGVFEVRSGILDIRSPLSGGSFLIQPTGVVQINSTIGGVTFTGSGEAIAVNSNARLAGSVSVEGSLVVNGPERLRLDASSSIEGTGSLLLRADGRVTASGWVLTIGPDASVRGRGSIEADTVVLGTVLADDLSGPLRVQQSAVQNEGTMIAAAGAKLLVSSSTVTQTPSGTIDAGAGVAEIANSAISGGTLASSQGGIVELTGTPSLADLTNTGAVTVIAPGDARLNGTIINDGVMGFSATEPNQTAGFLNLSPVSVLGSGRIELSNENTLNARITGQPLLTGPEQTVSGDGLIGPAWTLQGTLDPGGEGVGRILNPSTLVMADTAVYVCDVAGPDDHDVLLGQTVTLGGTLRLELDPGFVPDGAWSVPVMSFNVSASGGFDAVQGPQPADDRLRLRSWIAGGEVLAGWACAADVDLSGSLDVFDVFVYVESYLGQDPASDLAAPFGVWNFFDVQEFLRLFGAGCP